MFTPYTTATPTKPGWLHVERNRLRHFDGRSWSAPVASDAPGAEFHKALIGPRSELPGLTWREYAPEHLALLAAEGVDSQGWAEGLTTKAANQSQAGHRNVPARLYAVASAKRSEAA